MKTYLHALITVVCGLLAVTPIATIAWYSWDSSQNRGFEFGYFGTFNRVGHALAKIPGVTIDRTWANDDVTLEEFGYHISMANGRDLHLGFTEDDPLRDLSGEQLTEGLKLKIQQESETAPQH